MAWLVGMLCAGIIVGLFYLAVPMAPVMMAYFSEVLRSVGQ